MDNHQALRAHELGSIVLPLSGEDLQDLRVVLHHYSAGRRRPLSFLSDEVLLQLRMGLPASLLKGGVEDPERVAGLFVRDILERHTQDDYLRRVGLARTRGMGPVPSEALLELPFEDLLLAEVDTLHLPSLLHERLGSDPSAWEMFESLGEDWTATLRDLLEAVTQLLGDSEKSGDASQETSWEEVLPSLSYRKSPDVSSFRDLYRNTLTAWADLPAPMEMPASFQCGVYSHAVRHGQEDLLEVLVQGSVPLLPALQERYQKATSMTVRLAYLWSPQLRPEEVAGLYPDDKRKKVISTRALRSAISDRDRTVTP